MKTYNVEQIQKMTQAQFQDVLVDNTDKNYHTENVVYIAYRAGDYELIEKAEGILFNHLTIGHLTTELQEERQEVLKQVRKLFLPCHQQTIWECL